MPVSQMIGISTTVADLSRTLAFHHDWLGLARGTERVIDDPARKRLLGLEEAVSAVAASVLIGEQQLELIAFDPPGHPYPAERTSNDQWFEHVCLVTADMNAAWDRLRPGSPEAITEDGPQRLPPNTGGVTAFKFRDPDGHPLELLSFPQGVGAPVWQENKGTGLLGYDHTAISVTDVDRSIAFYTGLLGFHVGARSLNRGTEQDRLDGLVGCEVDVVALEPAAVATPHVELLHYRAPPSRSLTSAVRAADVASTRQIHKVDDLDALAGQLGATDTAFVSPGVVTFNDGERAAAVRDPDGHMIVLMGD